MRDFSMIVGGKPFHAEGTFEVVDPATGEAIASVPKGDARALDEAVDAARAAFPEWRDLDMAERRRLVGDVAEAMTAHKDELAHLISRESGKPIAGFGGKGAAFEVGGAIAWSKATTTFELEPRVISDTDASHIELHYKPLGVVGSITPWNFPLLIATWHVIPALVTGNTVVLKPSSLTPLATMRFVEIANDILPAGVLNVVSGTGGLGGRMSAHPGIDKIVFTGSTPTGRSIMRNASDTVKRLTLELGGNDAAIVLPDCDPDEIAPRIFAGAFANCGQVCGAIKRLYVHADIYDEVCDRLVALSGNMALGNGLEDATDFGPLQNAGQRDLVAELADDARARGAKVLCGGERPDGAGYFYPITLVSEIADGARLVDEEQFGPILPIIRFTDAEDALRRANASPNGLGGSVWSKDVALAEALGKRMECGTVWINKHAEIAPHVPFGGVKQSGFGIEFGAEGLKEFTSVQVVNVAKA